MQRLNVQGTVTGRMTSAFPALREFPRGNTPKPDSGMRLALLDLDFSDIERRAAANSGVSADDANPYGAPSSTDN